MEKENKIIVTLLAVFFVFVACWIGLRLYSGNLIVKAGALQNEYKSAQKQYQKKVTTISNSIYKNGVDTIRDSKVRNIFLLNTDNNILRLRADEFFKGYYNFTNTNQYMARATLLSPLLTDDIKNNEKLFDKKGSAGEKVVQGLGLSSKYQSISASVESDNDDEIKGLVSVKYQAGYKGATKGLGIRTYEMTFNKKQAKFTQIDLIATGIQNDSY